MTNKPNIECRETDLSRPSIDDQMRDSWEYLWSKDVEKLIGAIRQDVARPQYATTPVFVVSHPASPNRDSFYERMRRALPEHPIWDEVHVPVKPYTPHSHQQAAFDWLDNHPSMHLDIDAVGGISIDTASYFRQGINAARLSMIVRPLRGFGGHMDFEYPSIGGQFKLFSEHFGFNIISDAYVAPPKPEAKDWDKNARHWYKAAMGGKPMMNMAIAAYRASKRSVYSPEFDWENQRDARRKLHFIKHVNVGTVGHIDWGNNRLKRTRPYFPGYLADCIRAAIKEYK